MNGSRTFAGAVAMMATGCLWLFPIERKDAAPGDAGLDGSASGGMPDTGGTIVKDDVGEAPCQSNAQCSRDNLDYPYVCRPDTHKCQALRNDDCLIVHGNWSDPNAFFFGAYALLQPSMPQTSEAFYNYQLAIDEISTAGGGLVDNQGVQHPLVAVVCNNDPMVALTDKNLYQRTLHHLVDEIGVTAIVADLPPSVIIDAYQRNVKDLRKIFYLSPGPANNALFDLGDDGLVWNMLGPPKDLAPGYSALVKRIESYIRLNDPTVTSLRVGVVRSADATEANHQLLGELFDAVRPQLSFNNADQATNEKNGNYREFVVDAGDGGTITAVGAGVKNFDPHILISMAGKEFTDAHGVAYQVANDGRSDRYYPFYVLSPVNATAPVDVGNLIKSQAISHPIVYERFVGINVAGADDRTLYQKYITRLRNNVFKTASEDFENYYDAIYYLAYSVYLEGVEKPLDGQKMGDGMGRLSNGQRYNVGPDDMAEVFATLQPRDRSITLIGTGGSLFEVNHGVRTSKAGLFCFADNNGGMPLQHLQAEIYDAQQQTWTVQYECVHGL